MKRKIPKLFFAVFLLLFYCSKTHAQAPSFTSTPVTSGFENVAYTYSLSATDPNNNPLTFSSSNLPSWLSLTQGQNSTTNFGGAISTPGGIAGDSNGNIYVTENYGTNVYKITPDGTTTQWFTRASGSVYAMEVYQGYLYISYYGGQNKITKVDLNNPGAGETDVLTNLNGPLSLTFRGGYMYVSLYGASKVLKVNTINLPAAYNSASMDYFTIPNPFGIGFDKNGILYVAQYGQRKISKYDGSALTDVLTGFTYSPSDIKIDQNDKLYVSFWGGGGVRKYTSDLSSFIQVYNGGSVWGMSLTSTGTLVFGIYDQNKVVKLETGAVLTGTPTHADVGVYPVTVSVTNGTNSVDQSFNITITDPNPPTVTTYSPANNATGVALNTNLSLTFNEAINKGSGNIYIKKISDNSIVQTIDVNSNNVTINNNVLTIDPSADLPSLTGLYVTIDNTAILDASNNAYSGISNNSSWKFETIVQQLAQIITFNSNATVVYGASDFDPGAASDNASIPITYTSSNPTVATIVSGKVHILQAGSTTITASQAGNTFYVPATDATQNLTITPKTITLTLNATPAITKVYNGTATATLDASNYALNGVKSGDVVTVSGTAVYADKNAGTGKTVTVNAFVLAGAQKDDYALTTTSITATGTITVKPIILTLNAAPAITKVYDGNSTATLANGNYTLNAIEAGDIVTVSGTAAYADKVADADKTVTANAFVLAGAQKDNYSLTTASATVSGAITTKTLTITADDKTRFQGIANPLLTVSYAGFISGENENNLTVKPIVSTTATTNSLAGTYQITVSGAAATNYSITYVPGTLNVTPGYPTSVSLAQVTLYENRPSGTQAGTLSATSLDPNAIFTYSLVSGSGSTDNASFSISGNQLKAAASFNYEAKSSYSVRIRTTNQYGLYLEQSFTINITDVNEAPTLASIAGQTLCSTYTTQNTTLTGITPGPETAQSVTTSVSSTNPGLFADIRVSSVTNGTATLSYQLATTGTAVVTVTVKDNGGTANGGTDTFSQSFTLTVNELPVAAVASDKGTQIAKGETVTLTAAGGSAYNWDTTPNVSGTSSSAVIKVRPSQTTTYQVTVSNASGCSATKSITINVTDDYSVIDAANIVTPNGDGRNDTWIVKNLDMYPDNTVSIYDKGGRKLLEVKHYDNSWDGTFHGSQLSEGTYYYVIDFGAGKAPKKGFITILRNR